MCSAPYLLGRAVGTAATFSPDQCLLSFRNTNLSLTSAGLSFAGPLPLLSVQVPSSVLGPVNCPPLGALQWGTCACTTIYFPRALMPPCTRQ